MTKLFLLGFTVGAAAGMLITSRSGKTIYRAMDERRAIKTLLQPNGKN